VVVVAGITTAVIAIQGADRVVTDPVASATAQPVPERPALQVRNHAANPR
jgi:hypothetical protein